MLTVYIDFKSPASYLAMKPILALLERNGTTAEWKSFRTHERDIPKISGNASVGETHRQVRAASRRTIFQKYATLQGLALSYPDPLGDTDLALAALATMDGDPIPFINTAFDAYWVKHADLNDLTVVTDLLASATEASQFDKTQSLELLDLEQEKAIEAGVVDAPAILVDDQIFVGREHLPWIEEILKSKEQA